MSSTTMDISAGKERIQWIDALKGFAILLVILGHITQKYHSFDLYPVSTNAIGVIEALIYSFHMPLFMMISSYLFDRAYVDSYGEIKRDKLKTQFLNILIIYAFFSIVEGGGKTPIFKRCYYASSANRFASDSLQANRRENVVSVCAA